MVTTNDKLTTFGNARDQSNMAIYSSTFEDKERLFVQTKIKYHRNPAN